MEHRLVTWTFWICVGILIAYTVTYAYHAIESRDDIKVGSYYIKTSEKWDNNDPFELIDVDTILILGKSEGYVKYTLTKWNDSRLFISTKEKNLLKKLKPL